MKPLYHVVVIETKTGDLDSRIDVGTSLRKAEKIERASTSIWTTPISTQKYGSRYEPPQPHPSPCPPSRNPRRPRPRVHRCNAQIFGTPRQTRKGKAMTSKAQRRAKRKAASPFDLAPTPRREADGRPAREKAADRQTLESRCIRLGLPVTPEGLRDARAPWYGCKAGIAMASHTEAHNDRLRLWDAITHMRRTVAAYDAAIGAPRRHAVCMNLLTPPEPDRATPPRAHGSGRRKPCPRSARRSRQGPPSRIRLHAFAGRARPRQGQRIGGKSRGDR